MSFAGVCNVVMKTPMGDREAVLTLAEKGDALSGDMVADRNSVLHQNYGEKGRIKYE